MLTLVERTFGSKTVITVSGDVRATVTIKHTTLGAFFWSAFADDGSRRVELGTAPTFEQAEAQALAVVTTWQP